MSTFSFNTLTETDKLKLTVLCDVKKICQEVGQGLSTKVNFEKPAMELIAEMVWRKVEDYGSDLELFARHAKRTTINADDVKLLVRRNECLKEKVSKLSDDLNTASTSSKRKRKERDSDAGSDAGPSEGGDNIIGNFDLLDDVLLDD